MYGRNDYLAWDIEKYGSPATWPGNRLIKNIGPIPPFFLLKLPYPRVDRNKMFAFWSDNPVRPPIVKLFHNSDRALRLLPEFPKSAFRIQAFEDP
jgi:hypothetical protein